MESFALILCILGGVTLSTALVWLFDWLDNYYRRKCNK